MRKLVSVAAGVLLLGAGAAFVPAKAAVATTPVVDDTLKAALVAAKPTDRVAVHVHAPSFAAAKRAVTLKGLQTVAAFNKVNVVVAMGTPAQIKSLASTKGITRLQGDTPFKFHLDTSHTATRMAEARTLPATSGADGTGVTIAVIDSGIDGTHPMFQQEGASKVVRNMKLGCQLLVACAGTVGDSDERMWVDVTTSTNNSDTISAGGHGTHVAGIAAGVPVTSADGRVFSGAAPGAKLVGLSVGSGYAGYIADAGLNWVLEHHAKPCVDAAGAAYSEPVTCPPIKVVNLSLGPDGGGEFNAAGTTAVLQRQLVAAGVTVVWSAGNGDTTETTPNIGGTGADNRTSPYGSDPTPGVLMVANYDDADNGTRGGALDISSSRGRYGRPLTYPDLAAPGANITSACRPHLSICQVLGGHQSASDLDYGTISGTSMAAPYVAGIVADMLHVNPSLTPKLAEFALEDTATRFPFGAPYEADPTNASSPTSFDKGHGLVDAVGAIETAKGLTPSAAPAICSASSPVVKDNAGDSGAVYSADYFQSDPQMDIVEQNIAYDGANVTFTTKVVDLQASHPTVSTGFFHDTSFVFKGAPYDVRASRTIETGSVFSLRKDDGTLLSTVTGSFDPATDTITTIVPAGAFPGGIGAGDSLQVTSGWMYRQVGRSGLTVDQAKGYCPLYVLGSGAGPTPPTPADKLPAPHTPPQPVPLPAPEGSISLANPQFTWNGKITMDPESTAFGCAGWNEGGCQSKAVTVDVPAGGGTLTVDLIAPNLVPSDLDVYLYGPDGQLVGDEFAGATLGSTEKIVQAVTESGVYVIQVAGYIATPDTQFNAYLTISA